MYKSKEIRWFTEKENSFVINWFSNQGVTFSTIKPRTDFYLPLPEKEDISIKLREGNMEVKQRYGQPSLYELAQNANGYLEAWVKWSFDVVEADQLSNEIINLRKYNWVEIHKERLGLKITLEEDGSWKIHQIKEMLPSGCLLEYTKLKIKDKVVFTFAAEWFGESFIELDKHYLNQIFYRTEFNENDSLGYNAFINKLVT